MFKTIKLFLLATIVVIFVIPNLAFAQQVGDVPTPQAGSSCTDLQNNLMYKRSNDLNTNGEVSLLQAFLQSQGYPIGDPTGYFGDLTFGAVKSFQSQPQLGLLAYGYVGPATRETIKNISCGNTGTFTIGGTIGGVSSANLPAGCNSTYGYSPLTGVKCDSNINYPVPAVPTVPAGSTVYSPNGGETWTTGTNKMITWQNITQAYSACTPNYTNNYSCNAFDPISPIANKYDIYLNPYVICPAGLDCVPTSAPVKIASAVLGSSFNWTVGSYIPDYMTNNMGGVNTSNYVSDGAYTIRVCPVNIKYSNCDSSDNYFTITSKGSVVTDVPTIEFVGNPTLRLQYDPAGKESVLVGKATIKITAGGTPVDANGSPSMVRLFMNNGITNISNGTRYDLSPDSQNLGTYGSWIIPANTSRTFGVIISAPTRELFPGSYTLGSSLHTVSSSQAQSNPVFIMGETPRNVINDVPSYPPITIIGESSPYITSIVQDSTTAGFYDMYGNRFNATSNQVTINGITRDGYTRLPSTQTSFGPPNNDGMIMFTLKDFGITQKGTYVVQVSTNNGASNGYGFDFSGSGTTGSSPTISKTSGFNSQVVSPNTANVKIGSFTVQTGSATIGISSAKVYLSNLGYGITNISNLVLKIDNTVLGTPIGNPSSQNIFSFPAIYVQANQTRTFDIYADILGATSGSVNAYMGITFSQTGGSSNEITSYDGVTTTSTASSLANPVLSQNSPVSQFVIGGSNFGIATYKVSTASAGTNANITGMGFNTTGTDAIESITVGGVTKAVTGFGATTITGLNIPVSSSGADIPVTIKLSGFQNSTTGGFLTVGIDPVKIVLNHIAASSGSGSFINNNVLVSSNSMTLVASKPTVQVSAGGQNSLVLGQENKIGEFTVTADANGKIAVSSVGLSLISTGITNPSYGSIRIANGNTPINGVTIGTSVGDTRVINFNNPYQISAGLSTTFSVYAVVNGIVQTGGSPTVSSGLLSPQTFIWNDIIGGNIQYTGNNIYNFPTNSYTVRGSGNVTQMPTLSALYPAIVSAGTVVTISGTNLSGVSGLEFYSSNGQLVGTLSPSSVSATNVVFTVDPRFALNASQVTYQVGVVTNACAGGCSSNRLAITLNASSPSVPSAPSLTIDNLTSKTGLPSDSFTLNWGGSNNNPTEYKMFVTGAFNSGDTLSQANRTSFTFGGATSLAAFGLRAGTYNFTIRACNASGCSGDSNVVTYVAVVATGAVCPPFIIPYCPNGTIVSGGVDSNQCQIPSRCVVTPISTPTPTPTAPAVPSAPNLTIDNSDRKTGLPSDSFTLNWMANSGNTNTTEYKMFVTGAFNSGDTLSQAMRTSFTFGGDTSLAAFGLGAGTYNFTIRACNISGCSGDSNVVTYVATSAATPGNLPPSSGAPTCADPQAYYYYYNQDVARAYADGLHDAKYHWNTYGWNEGRRSCWTTHPIATLGGTSSLALNAKAPRVLGDYTTCVDIPYNMHRGYENNNVKNLQSFFVQKGLLTDTPTGFYGDKTVEAVNNYQASKGLPVTGMVFEFTRLAIKSETCK